MPAIMSARYLNWSDAIYATARLLSAIQARCRIETEPELYRNLVRGREPLMFGATKPFRDLLSNVYYVFCPTHSLNGNRCRQIGNNDFVIYRPKKPTFVF